MNELNRANCRIAALAKRVGILDQRVDTYHAALEILLSTLKAAGLADRRLDTCSGLLGVAFDLAHKEEDAVVEHRVRIPPRINDETT